MSTTLRREPTCRTCYANSLSIEERIRFLAEQVTMPVHYCPEHQQRAAEIENMFAKMVAEGKVIWQGSMTGRMPRHYDRDMLDDAYAEDYARDVERWAGEGGRDD